MKQKTFLICSCSAALLVALCTGLWMGMEQVNAAGEYVVIINNGVAVDSVSASDFESILLGDQKKWADGSKVYIAVLGEGPATEAFLKTHAKKTPDQFKTYWKKLVFTGKGIEPKTLDAEADLVAYVASTAGAVGYVASGTAHDGVKELAIN